jgi:hypothetical protein
VEGVEYYPQYQTLNQHQQQQQQQQHQQQQQDSSIHRPLPPMANFVREDLVNRISGFPQGILYKKLYFE